MAWVAYAAYELERQRIERETAARRRADVETDDEKDEEE